MVKLGEREEFKAFKKSLPEGLAKKLDIYKGSQWLPERWNEIGNVRTSIIDQSGDEKLWDILAQNFSIFYERLDLLNENATSSGRFERPLKLSKEKTNYLVRFDFQKMMAFVEIMRQVPEIAIDERVLSAFEINHEISYLSKLLFREPYYYRPHLFLATEVALHDPENLGNAIRAGKRSGIEYVQALARHPYSPFLRDQRVVERLRQSHFPVGLVHLAEHVGLADLLMEITEDSIDHKPSFNGVLGVFPFSIQPTALTEHEYYIWTDCLGLIGIQRQDLVGAVEHYDKEQTIALFPGKREFGSLHTQYYYSKGLPGCVGYLKFIEYEDGILIGKNKTAYRAPTQLDRMSDIIQEIRGAREDLELNDEYIKKFDQTPEILWWAAHEYAKRRRKKWVAITDSDYHIKISNSTLKRRMKYFLDSIKIEQNDEDYKVRWQYVYDNAKPKVLTKEEADRHYCGLVQGQGKRVRLKYISDDVNAWQVPVMQVTPLTKCLKERTAEQILFQ